MEAGLVARRGIAYGSGLGKTRWVVEWTFAWLSQFKRLWIRYEIRRADLHLGLQVVTGQPTHRFPAVPPVG
ncbi:hypothetical protein GCM10018790_49930 [Kitasatospora xanthocidica]|nr:hypothetical protein GCM10018790_49930 [Kitasatospora xanthocidica]